MDKEGKIRTVVNASGKAGGTGDGGPALEALMNGHKHLCVDRDNSVIIADAESNLVRRYVPSTGRIERVAGTGQKGSDGVDGAPEKCGLARGVTRCGRYTLMDGGCSAHGGASVDGRRPMVAGRAIVVGDVARGRNLGCRVRCAVALTPHRACDSPADLF